MTGALRDICRDGVLRAAINTGNRALVQTDGETLTGISPHLAQRLADHIGVRLKQVVYDGAGKVFDDAGSDVWDVAFLAIDATRAQRISFTRPYHVIEATFAVRRDGPVQRIEDFDRVGVHLLTSTGSAYDMYLKAHAKNATLEHSGTPGESFAEFRAGRSDMVAGVRASLLRTFDDDPEFTVLPGTLTKVEQAMVLPGADNPLIDVLDSFLADQIDAGVVRHALG